ncbi:MAG TPA: substrate-binding domain-containing protein [Candidatus Acidoferrales bacterium]|nr:substrate-binding domain-containing protein [Candidatus Acidoferrales bacterium]
MPQELKIAVMPRSSFSYFWKSFYAGVKQAESDFREANMRVTVQCDAPARDDDYEMQIEIYKKFTRQQVDGMVLAPCHSRIIDTVEAAAGTNIPIVVVDSDLETTRKVSFVGTNNSVAGGLAAQRMGQQLKGNGRVLVLHHQKGSRNTEEREQGFTRHLQEAYPAVEIPPTEEYAGATRDSARLASARLLAQFGDRFQGIFTLNETSTAGMLMALQGTRVAGNGVLIGFDYSDIYISSVRGGKIQGLVLQNPFRMGELGVKTLVEHLQGKRVSRIIDTGATLLTPENIDTPAIHAFLELETGKSDPAKAGR